MMASCPRSWSPGSTSASDERFKGNLKGDLECFVGPSPRRRPLRRRCKRRRKRGTCEALFNTSRKGDDFGKMAPTTGVGLTVPFKERAREAISDLKELK